MRNCVMRSEIIRLCRQIKDSANTQDALKARRELSLELGLVELPKHSELLGALVAEVALLEPENEVTS
jgi:hypothetical protein